MALSNIFVEPRREITESLVGIGAVVGITAMDYAIVKGLDCFFQSPPGSLWKKMGIVLVLMIVVYVVVGGILVVTHSIGTSICNFLEKRGVQARPKRRYK